MEAIKEIYAAEEPLDSFYSFSFIWDALFRRTDGFMSGERNANAGACLLRYLLGSEGSADNTARTSSQPE